MITYGKNIFQILLGFITKLVCKIIYLIIITVLSMVNLPFAANMEEKKENLTDCEGNMIMFK